MFYVFSLINEYVMPMQFKIPKTGDGLNVFYGIHKKERLESHIFISIKNSLYHIPLWAVKYINNK